MIKLLDEVLCKEDDKYHYLLATFDYLEKNVVILGFNCKCSCTRLKVKRFFHCNFIQLINSILKKMLDYE